VAETQEVCGSNAARRRQRISSIVLIAVCLPLLGALSAAKGPLLIYNNTPSEPLGFYIRTARAPRLGALAAFRAPASAFPYADHAMPQLHHEPILKRLAAGPGERVCTTGGHLVINGRTLGLIVQTDLKGRALPHWTACRTLGAQEFFALSLRVPNSFDSRYFGPVRRTDILGVYAPVGAL